MSVYDGFTDFREVPGKASKGPQASLGGSRGSLGGRQSVPSPGRSQEPGGSRKESSPAMGVRLVGSLEGPKGFLGHLGGVSARSSGSPVTSSGIRVCV